MKKILILISLFCFSYSVFSQVSFGRPQNIDLGWKFMLGDSKNASEKNFDDSGWRVLNLPHDWSVEGNMSPDKASCTGYLPAGIAWYRKTLDIPESKKGEKAYVYFEGVYNNSSVYVNGTLVGERPNGFVSFLYDITPYIKYGERNSLAVRVDHHLYADSRWYTGSGIYRDVYLVYADPVHIDQWGVSYETKDVGQKGANIVLSTKVNNGSSGMQNLSVEQELFYHNMAVKGTKVRKNIQVKAGTIGTFQQSVFVDNKNLHLWSVDFPDLYVLKTSVYNEKKQMIDETETNVGIRVLKFDHDTGFSLNGKNMKLKGVCLHNDAGVLGSAVPEEVWEIRLKTLKSIGCNAIRMSHNPESPELYDLCDKFGFLVMDEAFDEWEYPKRKWIEGWNEGNPGFDGYAAYFNKWGEKDLHDMVERDKCHPSVIMWSIGNEVDYPNDPYTHPILDHARFGQKVYGGYQPDKPNAERLGEISKRLVKVVKEVDVSRPVTAALAGVTMSNYTDYPGSLDVVGYNYTEDRYREDHDKYPKRIIFGSENRQDIDAWYAVKNSKYIFGQFLWTGIDYLGESGRWPSRGFYSGLLDLAGQKKPRAYFRESLWAEKPMAYIGTYPSSYNTLSVYAWPEWNYKEGENIRVVCYTNCSKVKLLLNGEPVGDPRAYDKKTGIVYWDIPFHAGELKAVGLNDKDKEVTNYVIKTSGLPYALEAKTDVESLDKNRGVAIIHVQIKDREGNPAVLSDNEISCKIEGPATLLGMEAGNNEDMTAYKSSKRQAFKGKLVVYVQSEGKPGVVKLLFSSPLLKETSVNLNIK